MVDTPIRYVTQEEFGALLSACNELLPDRALWWRAFLTCCYTAGLRYSEAVHLTWGDLDFGDDTIRVSPKSDSKDTIAWTPKDYETRTIPVPARTMAMLVAMQQSAPHGHAYIFLDKDRLAAVKRDQEAGEWRDDRAVLNNFQWSFRQLVKAAARIAPSLATWGRDKNGEPRSDKTTISLHDFRRSAITNWSKEANIQTVMAMAGHSNIETTRRYYAVATEDQMERVRHASEAALTKAVWGVSDARMTQNEAGARNRALVTSSKARSIKDLPD